MYGFLAFASGVLLSIMLQMNGGLSARFGIYHAALYIHIIGVGFALAALLLRRKRVSAGREQPAQMDQARARHGRKRVSPEHEQPAWMDQARARHDRKRVSPEREQPAWMHQARARHDRKRVSPEREQPAWMHQARARHGRKCVSPEHEQPTWMDQARARHGRKCVSPEHEQPTWMDQARAGHVRKRASAEREQPTWMDQARAGHGRKRVWLGRRLPLWMYLGGAIGVITTVCCNLASLRLSLTCLTALSLFAQLAVSCLIDVFGWLGMERRGRRALKPWSLLLSLAGIALLADRSASQLPYALAALATGASIVASRSVNARLSQQIGALPGSFVNHLVGLPLCLLAVLLVPEIPTSAPLPLWCWGGGILGVVTVLIANVVVPHLPASRMTLLTLCGQLLCGLLLDILARGTVNPRELAAALLIAISSQLGHSPARAKRTR